MWMARYGSPFVSAYTMQEVQIRNSSKILKNTGNTKTQNMVCMYMWMAGYGDPPVRAYDMHGPNTDYGIIQPYHGILQPALIHIIAQCKYESKYEYKFK